MITKVQFIAAGAAFLIVGGVWCLLHSNQLVVRTVDITSGDFSKVLQGKVLVQMSDLHIGRDGLKNEAEIRTILAELNPDLILLTGDYVSWFGEAADYQEARDFLRFLSAPLGVYAVLGDADYWNERESCGFCHSRDPDRPAPLQHVQFLRDTYVDVPVARDTLRVAGWEGGAELNPEPLRLQEWAGTRPTILLSHSSLIWASLPENSNVLVLSGDTHGGEIYMPSSIWKLWKRKPDPEHMYGYFQNGRKHLYVTSGIGTDLPFRFGVPPEIVVFRFH